VTEKMQNEIDSITKDYMHIEKQLVEGKADWNRKDQEYNDKINTLYKTGKAEKEKYYEKIEALNNEINSKGKDITNLNHQVTTLTTNLQRKENRVEELTSDFSSYKQNSERNTEMLKSTLKNLEQEIVDKKMNYEKEIALARQNMVHQTETIEKLEQEVQKMNADHEEKITSIKQNLVS